MRDNRPMQFVRVVTDVVKTSPFFHSHVFALVHENKSRHGLSGGLLMCIVNNTGRGKVIGS